MTAHLGQLADHDLAGCLGLGLGHARDLEPLHLRRVPDLADLEPLHLPQGATNRRGVSNEVDLVARLVGGAGFWGEVGKVKLLRPPIPPWVGVVRE